ncbi:Peroxisomal multifunctional enzyme type 2 [Amphibalanus amphitrite]|uniref:Peroxisomal multifunctional enzyme type 2 n=1 Tax=Amphibalanus amphitrite TaxID=1232801 RepID=A0A6A4VNA2_AMPAM|nr:Peroxisomal multifunctional enzyme type 2 [Amphibalanus amphitrite]
MEGELRFDGQVAVITGAGGGLGREYALLLAARGAAVVVNDLGSSADGQGRSKTADRVVQEIKDKGGRAVANYDSVEEGHKIVQTAIDEFGRIDILINNAGFLRDRSFAKMEENDWDMIHRVHLRGAFVTTRAAWPHFRRQEYGRIVLTSSAAGLFGNFGQTNYSQLVVTGVITASVETEDGRSCQGRLYVVDGGTPLLGRDLQKSLCISTWHGSTVYEVDRQPGRSSDVEAGNDQDSATQSAAKMGLIGLGKTLALEGERHNIITNVLVPAALSRLTESLLPPELQRQMAPVHVAPVVAVLCHRRCPAAGAVVEAAGGAAATYRWQRSAGIADLELTPEKVLDQWEVLDAADPAAESPDTPAAQMALLSRQLTDAAEREAERREVESAPAGTVDVSRALRTRLPPARFTYGPRDAALYALSIGVSLEQRHGLRYLYEAADGFEPHPMFASVVFSALDMTRMASLPGFPIDLTQLLHGEQYMELKKQLPPSATLEITANLADIIDKGDKGAIVLLDVHAADSSGDEVAFIQQSLFVRGAGGFGGHARSQVARPCAEVPPRAPDATLSVSTNRDQAALYRLNGDLNPLHIDPEFAALGGQSRPILHGLCGLGASVHAVLEHYSTDREEPAQLNKVKVRFSRPVLPGQTLLVDTWREPGSARVVFQSRVKETGQLALAGYLELRDLDVGARAKL